MGGSPFSPFRELDPNTPRLPSPLDKSGLALVGDLYKAMAERYHWSAREVDELELWEVAVYLGNADASDPMAEFMERAKQKMATGVDPLLESITGTQ